MSRYLPLGRHLTDQPADAAVEMTFDAIEDLVGRLPPSAARRQWWANPRGRPMPQAQAWLGAGRRVLRVDLANRSVTFTTASQLLVNVTRPPAASAILDGVAALTEVLRRAGYDSIPQAVAAHTVFLHPETVAQTAGGAILPVIRRSPGERIGAVSRLPTGQHVLLDDNTSPARVFLWAAARRNGPDVQVNHVWTDSRNPHSYTALWNLCATPAFLAKTTDGGHHPEVRRVLQFRAFELFGHCPQGQPPPSKPAGYDNLKWAEHPTPIEDLEKALRRSLQRAPKSRPAIAARQLGWIYSGWSPDTAITTPRDR